MNLKNLTPRACEIHTCRFSFWLAWIFLDWIPHLSNWQGVKWRIFSAINYRNYHWCICENFCKSCYSQNYPLLSIRCYYNWAIWSFLILISISVAYFSLRNIILNYWLYGIIHKWIHKKKQMISKVLTTSYVFFQKRQCEWRKLNMHFLNILLYVSSWFLRAKFSLQRKFSNLYPKN